MMKRGRAETIIGEVTEAVSRWPDFAEKAGVGSAWREQVSRNLRQDILSS